MRDEKTTDHLSPLNERTPPREQGKTRRKLQMISPNSQKAGFGQQREKEAFPDYPLSQTELIKRLGHRWSRVSRQKYVLGRIICPTFSLRTRLGRSHQDVAVVILSANILWTNYPEDRIPDIPQSIEPGVATRAQGLWRTSRPSHLKYQRYRFPSFVNAFRDVTSFRAGKPRTSPLGTVTKIRLEA